MDAQSERDSVAVASANNPDNALQQVLSILKSGPSASSSAVPAGDEPLAQSEQKTSAPTGPGDLSDEESSDDDGLSFARRLADASGKKAVPKQTAKAKAAPKAQQRASVSSPALLPSTARQPTPKPVMAGEGKVLAQAETAEEKENNGKNEAACKSTFLLDGRGNRTKETLNKHLKEFAARRVQMF